MTNRNMIGFDLALGTGALLAPDATLRALGHEDPSPDARELFRRCGPIWLTFAAAHADRRTSATAPRTGGRSRGCAAPSSPRTSSGRAHRRSSAPALGPGFGWRAPRTWRWRLGFAWLARQKPSRRLRDRRVTDEATVAFAGVEGQARLLRESKVSARELVEIILAGSSGSTRSSTRFAPCTPSRPSTRPDRSSASCARSRRHLFSECRSRSRTTRTSPATSPPTGPSVRRAGRRRLGGRPARSGSRRNRHRQDQRPAALRDVRNRVHSLRLTRNPWDPTARPGVERRLGRRCRRGDGPRRAGTDGGVDPGSGRVVQPLRPQAPAGTRFAGATRGALARPVRSPAG